MTSWPGSPSRAGGWPTRSGSPSPRTSRTPSSRSPPAPGPPPMTPTARSGPAPGSRRSPACWTWRPGRAGMRVIVRKERPHPGAQLRFTDIDGHRFTAFATSTKGGQLADLELRHRRRATVRGPDPLRQGHRAAQPAPAGLHAEPDLVRDRRHGLRTAGLDADARPGRPRPPLGTQTAAAADLHLRRAHRPRRPPPAAPPRRQLALGHGRSPPRSPACRPSHPADQPEPIPATRKDTPGPVEPRPPGATAGPPGTTAH